MTKEEILAMEPGPELDASVEERLFNHQCEMRYCNWLPGGWYEVQSYGEGKEVVGGGLLDENELHPCYKEGEKWTVTPFYSTDISAAWPVVGKMGLAVFPLNNTDWACCRASYIYHLQIDQDHYADERLVICRAAPEAICKAALIIFVGK